MVKLSLHLSTNWVHLYLKILKAEKGRQFIRFNEGQKDVLLVTCKNLDSVILNLYIINVIRLLIKFSRKLIPKAFVLPVNTIIMDYQKIKTLEELKQVVKNAVRIKEEDTGRNLLNGKIRAKENTFPGNCRL